MRGDKVIDWLHSRFDKETDPQQAFLVIDYDNIDEHVRYSAWIYGRISKQLSEVEREYESTKMALEEFQGRAVKLITEKVNPQTQRVYSVEYAKEVVKEVSKYKHLKSVVINLRCKVNELKRYLKALEFKITMTPGAQGRHNISLRAEEQEHELGEYDG